MNIQHLTALSLAAAGLFSCGNPAEKPLTDEVLYAEFQDPGPRWRGKPFWSWNGQLEKDELLRQLNVFREMGMGGAFMHSRVGLRTEYLGDEWFALTSAVADSAAALGLEAYLYDEDRWPSGSAGGEVTRDHPELRMNFVELFTLPAEEFHWDNDSILAAFACDLNGLDYSNLQRLDRDSDMGSYRGKTVLKFLHRTRGCTDVYNGGTYLDVFNPDATREFIRLTHEKYKEHCGERFGKEIKGIFTDEPHRGGLFTDFDGNPNGVGNHTRTAPWTPKMPEAYREKFGGDLVNDLPKLFLRENGQRVNDVKWKYCELAESLFLENFARPQYDWCTENSLAYTGHVLHEDNLTSQAAMQGSLMRYYEYMHIPGIDILTEGNRSFWAVKQLSSVGRQLGKKQLLSETYGVTGWQFDFEGHKAVGDWQALFGVNVRCHHLSWYTMQGEAKRDYPASIFFQSAWWKDYKYVEDYYARLGLILGQGEPVCDLLVVNPIESVWSQVCIGSFDQLMPRTPEIREMERKYADLFHWLAGHRIDFDYGDEEMMGRLARIARNPDGTPLLQVGQAAYKAVLVGNMETMRSSTLALLEKFRRAGGTVIFAGEAPRYVDALPSEAPAALAETSVQTAYEKNPLIAAVHAAVGPTVRVTYQTTGQNIPSVFGQMRRDKDRQYIVLMNVERKDLPEVEITLPTGGKIARWDCRSGLVWQQEASGTDTLTIRTSFSPLEEKVYVVSPTLPAFAQKPVAEQTVSEASLPGRYAYRLDEPNLCVLDVATWEIEGEKEQPLNEILKIDRAIRRHYGLPYRGGEMLQPWYAEKYVPGHADTLGRVTLRFPFDIQTLPADSLYLCLETPERFIVRVNGKSTDKQDKGWHIDPAIRKIALPASLLRKGHNEISLNFAFSRDIDLEAMLLAGHFGVRLDGIKRTLTSLPDSLHTGDVTTQGLPFYSGGITYLVDSLPVPDKGQRVWIETKGYAGACLKTTDGETAQMACWPPYRLDVTASAAKRKPAEVTVVLTRRNTFGPLHALPAKVGAYGPMNWITEGRSFTLDAYALLPAGLTAPLGVVVTQATD